MERNPVVIESGNSAALQSSFWYRAPQPVETDEASRVSHTTAQVKAAYDIVPIRAEHINDVMNFLRRTFFLDEPLNVHLQLVANAEPGTCPELEEFSMSALNQGLSLMAVAPNGQIIGTCLNSNTEPSDVDELEQQAQICPNPKFKLILGLLAHVEKQSNVHDKFHVDKVFDVPMLSVDGNWRGQGIATALLKGSIQLAQRLGYKLFRVDCSSDFTARAVAKLGLYPIFTMRYTEYRPSPDQEPPFDPAPPHHEVKAYVKTLNEA